MKLLINLLFAFLTLVTAHHKSWWIQSDMSQDQNLHFRLVLPQQNVNEFLDCLDDISNIDSSNYGRYLSNEYIKNMISPPLAHRRYVLERMRHENITCLDGGDYLPCTGTVRDVERVFKVKMKVYRNNHGSYAERSSISYEIPSDLVGLIEWIDGLSNHLIPHYPPKRTTDLPSYTADSGYVSREVVERLYSINGGLVIHNSSGAAIEFQDGGYGQSDLDQSLVFNNLSPNKVTCNHGTNSGGDIETMLDMDMIVDIAGNVSMCYLNYQNWIFEFAVDLQNMTDRPNVVSVSYGWSEQDQCSIVECGNETAQQYIDRANVELAKLGALGVTVLVSSGDAGAPGRTNEGCDSESTPINPVFPGSSPYVVSVGATFVVAGNSSHNWTTPLCTNFGCANGTVTKVINYNDTGWTSGSGFTIYPTTRPSWQNDVVNEYLNSGVYLPNESTWNKNGRGYPDVVALGHNCAVYGVDGMSTFSGVDGTSCSAPIFAALMILANDYQASQGRPPLGFVNPLLYKLASSKNTPFTRPLGGNTHCTEFQCCSEEYGFQSPPHETTWDPVTGLGELNLVDMLNGLDIMFE